MRCPACREEMIVVEYKDIELDVCNSCKGVWFDAEELELLLGSLQLPVEELIHKLRGKSSEEVRKCPSCRRKMEKVLVGPGKGEVIDRCRKGHGLWFDGGELDKVIHRLKKPEAVSAPAQEDAEKVGSFLAEVLFAEEAKK
jgi:Zn-finger nucleic acid-binding protein